MISQIIDSILCIQSAFSENDTSLYLKDWGIYKASDTHI